MRCLHRRRRRHHVISLRQPSNRVPIEKGVHDTNLHPLPAIIALKRNKHPFNKLALRAQAPSQCHPTEENLCSACTAEAAAVVWCRCCNHEKRSRQRKRSMTRASALRLISSQNKTTSLISWHHALKPPSHVPIPPLQHTAYTSVHH